MSNPEQKKTSGIPRVTDDNIDKITRALIGSFIKEVEEYPYGDTPIEKIKYYLVQMKSEKLLEGVGDLSSYLHAHAAERQAKALEQIASHVTAQQISNEVDNRRRAITEQREPKREYLTITYSLPSETLSMLWAMRGILMDASIKSLSVPDRLDPYQRVSTEDMALTFRLSVDDFLSRLPRNPEGEIDFSLLAEFDCLHYGGTDSEPDEWIFGG